MQIISCRPRGPPVRRLRAAGGHLQEAARLGIPAVSVAPGQAGEYVGFLGGFWGFDGPATAQITRELLGWQPAGPGLIADLKAGHYFA